MPAATGCAPTRHLETTAAIAARRFTAFRPRSARASGCGRVHWEAIVRAPGLADRIAGRPASLLPISGATNSSKKEGAAAGGNGRSGVRSTEVELCPGATCVPVAREILQPGQWPEFPRPARHVEHMFILLAEHASAYGLLVPHA